MLDDARRAPYAPAAAQEVGPYARRHADFSSDERIADDLAHGFTTRFPAGASVLFRGGHYSWRQDALAGVAEALRRGTGKTERELALEREVKQLRHVVTETAIEKELLKQALELERARRPTGPGRSSP